MHDVAQRVSLEPCRRMRANGKHNAFTGLVYLGWGEQRHQ